MPEPLLCSDCRSVPDRKAGVREVCSGLLGRHYYPAQFARGSTLTGWAGDWASARSAGWLEEAGVHVLREVVEDLAQLRAADGR